MSDDGTRLIVNRSNLMNLETGSHEGNADIYNYDNNSDSWSLDKRIEIIGNTDSISIADSTNRDQVGVAISGDGQTIAIGNPKGGDVSTYQGQVLFYELDTSTNTWNFNEEIFGETSQNLGYHNSIALSDTGSTAVLGGYGGSSSGVYVYNDTGNIRTYTSPIPSPTPSDIQPPTFISHASVNIDENITPGVIADVSAIDETSNVTYGIKSGGDSALFSIDSEKPNSNSYLVSTPLFKVFTFFSKSIL